MAASADAGPQRQPDESCEFDRVIVGAGLSGLYAIHGSLQQGHRVCAFEAGSGVGGTWYWNRYPGCRVDIESFEYSYSFSEALQQEWEWSERYAAQPEVERYCNHVADRFDLRRQIRFETRVEAAHFDETSARWVVRTDRGQTVIARVLIMATGTFSDPYLPPFEGLEAFGGRRLQTSRWPREPVDFAGQRVGVIGTGASGVQLIPIIARQASHLTVFQRTAAHTVPLQNRPVDADQRRRRKAEYARLRENQWNSQTGFTLYHGQPEAPVTRSALEISAEERVREYESRWASGGLCFYNAFADLLVSEEANRTLEDYLRDKIRSRVSRPGVAEKLIPRFNPALTKRLAGDTGYCETFDRDNVELVDLRAEPIRRFTETGLIVGEREVGLDIIVFATGFDLGTGAMNRIDIRGRDGRRLRDHWSAGPRNCLGLMAAGFPNLFWLFGPGTPFYNPVLLAEYQMRLIDRWSEAHLTEPRAVIEASAPAEQQWTSLSNTIAEATLFARGDNYYMGSNIPGKPRACPMFLGGFQMYRQHCEAAVIDPSGLVTAGDDAVASSAT